MKKHKDIEALLPGDGKQNNFRVPENYFEQLPGKMREKIRMPEEEIKTIKMPVPHRMMTVAGVAAAVVAFVFIGYFFVHYLNTTHSPVPEGSVSYIFSTDIDDQTLYEFIQQEDISTEFSKMNTTNVGSIIDYLADKGVDDYLLAQQL